MGTPSEQTSLLNVLPQEEFFVRHAEVQQLFHAGLDVSRSLQTSCFLRGKHKSGKTEILRRVYNKLFFEQDRVIPFFHAVPKMLFSCEDFCRDYFLRSASQYIGFLRRDPRLVLTDEFDLRLIVQLAYETKLAWIVDTINHFSLFLKNHDRRALSRLAVQFPATAAMKSGLGAFVLIDDFHHMRSIANPDERAGLIHDFL